MNRLYDWEIRLTDLFVSRLSAPFEWGANDCCLFAADGKLAATGIDPARDHRGTYSDALSAARTVEKLGGMISIGDSSFGPRIKNQYARFGDIGLIENHGRPCLAIFGGEYFHAPGIDGLTIFPVDKCLQAWSLT